MADKIGRRTALITAVLNVSLATGAMALTPEGGWIYLVVCRFFVGFGVTGLYSVDITLMQEFSPAISAAGLPGSRRRCCRPACCSPRCWGHLPRLISAGAGWSRSACCRRSCACTSVHSSPNRRIGCCAGPGGRGAESLAWALKMDPAQITLPAVPPAIEHTRWLEIFKYPRSIIAGCLTGLTQTGGVALALWQVTLFVMVLKITPPEASKLVIWVSLSAIAGRFFCSWISDAWGRRASGIFACLIAAVFMSMAGYLHDVFVGGVSMFFVMIVLQNFFGSGNYSIVGPYMGEMWPARLRGSGMGFVYGIGNLGKFIGPAGLALIAGSSNYVNPKATLDALIPGFNYFAFWYVLGAVAFWLIGMETRGRTIEEIDSAIRGRQQVAGGSSGASCRQLIAAVSRGEWTLPARSPVLGPVVAPQEIGAELRLGGLGIWAITRSISVRKMSTTFLTQGPRRRWRHKVSAGRKRQIARRGTGRSGYRRRGAPRCRA